MKSILLIIASLFCLWHPSTNNVLKCCNEFNELNTKIRDGKIPQSTAIAQFVRITKELQSLGTNEGADFVFPLEGYDKKSIGGTNGNGYLSKGYNYFDGNLHKAHPAHDIFISDNNQDCRDDRTKKAVHVLSVSDGIVVAAENTWNTKSTLRGGKYIWIYSRACNSLFYYAHNDNISVNVGDKVKAGDVIATVGRTGLNAFKNRSPTPSLYAT